MRRTWDASLASSLSDDTKTAPCMAPESAEYFPLWSDVMYPVANPAGAEASPACVSAENAPLQAAMPGDSAPSRLRSAPAQKELPVSSTILKSLLRAMLNSFAFVNFIFPAMRLDASQEGAADSHRIEKYIDGLSMAGELSKGVPEMVRMVRGGCDIRRAVYKLRSKEGKGTRYVADFVMGYLSEVEEAGIDSYKRCRMVNKARAGKCGCKFPESPVLRKKELEDLRNVLGLLKSSQLDEPYKEALGTLTRLSISTGRTRDIARAYAYIINAQPSQSAGVSVYLMEYAHYFYARGLFYECYKIIDAISRMGDITASVDRMRLMMMSHFFLLGGQLRMYCCAVARAKSLGLSVEGNLSPWCSKYAKYQKVAKDYDHLIGYKAPPAKSEQGISAGAKELESPGDMPGGARGVATSDMLKKWAWYEAHLGKGVRIEDEGAVDAIAFLRRNRLNYKIEDGQLFVAAGISTRTVADYIRELEPKPDIAKPAAVAESREAKVGAQAEAQRSIESKQKDGAAERAAERARAAKARALFEQGEFLLRLHLERSRERIAAADNAEEPDHDRLLSIVNERFRAAKEEEIEMVERVKDKSGVVTELAAELSERLQASKPPKAAPAPAVAVERAEAPTYTYERANLRAGADGQEDRPKLEWKRAPGLSLRDIAKVPAKDRDRDLVWKRREKEQAADASGVYRVGEVSAATKELFSSGPRAKEEKEKEKARKLVWKRE